MMNEPHTCPVCLGDFGESSKNNLAGDITLIICNGCGTYKITREAFINYFNHGDKLTRIQRAALSHTLLGCYENGTPFSITNSWLELFLANAELPTASAQMRNLVKRIGDRVLKTGEGYRVDEKKDTPAIGSLNVEMFNTILEESKRRNITRQTNKYQYKDPNGDGIIEGKLFNLSFDGWDIYESEKRGIVISNYGFVAMKFSDDSNDALENFIQKLVKPSIHNAIGYKIIDLRDVGCAGIIDNLMRTKIRDSAFVLADLTHDNSGAYWEAGYAEGLGKPVIYLCEKKKFAENKTHFDTNHCTTIMWDKDQPKDCIDALIATIRRSISLFPESGHYSNNQTI